MRTHILRIARTDRNGEHMLLNVSQSGSKSLNLKLIATEQEHLYHATIRQSQLGALRAKTYSGSDEEWEAILKYALLRHQTDDIEASVLQGLEAVANISSHVTTVTLRKNIGGVIQRLGSFKLEEDDAREEVSFPEWVEVAVTSADELRTELETALASLQSQKQEAERLNAQLDELIEAKRKHEEELLNKFAALLNSKKLKIRDQQRLLATVKVSDKIANIVAVSRTKSAIQTTLQDSRNDKALSSRKRKKSSPTPNTTVNDATMSDGTDNTDENAAVHEETPEPSDHGGISSDGDSDDQDAFEGERRVATAIPNRSSGLKSGNEKPPASTITESAAPHTDPSDEAMDDETDDEL